MKKYLFILLFLLILICPYKCKKETVQSAPVSVLSDEVEAQIVIENGSLSHLRKTKANKTETKKYLLPRESRVTIIQNIDNKIEVKVTNKGLAFTPAVSFLVLNQKPVPALYLRLIYYENLALGPSVTLKGSMGLAFEKRFLESKILGNTSFLFFVSKNSAGLGIAVSL